MLILFNKPYGVLSQFSPEGQHVTLKEFINIPDVYPAGRLDKNSEGLLLLTSDGRLQHELSHPKFGKTKQYWVQVEGIPDEDVLKPLRQGLYYRNQYYEPATVEMIAEPSIWPRQPPIRTRLHIPTSWLNITLTEGKNHQVRHMTAAIGFPTLRLVRHQIGSYTLNDLKPGAYQIVE